MDSSGILATTHQNFATSRLPRASEPMKLDYLPANPVRRGLVASPEHWRYSSAHEWLGGAPPVLRCDPWK